MSEFVIGAFYKLLVDGDDPSVDMFNFYHSPQYALRKGDKVRVNDIHPEAGVQLVVPHPDTPDDYTEDGGATFWWVREEALEQLKVRRVLYDE